MFRYVVFILSFFYTSVTFADIANNVIYKFNNFIISSDKCF